MIALALHNTIILITTHLSTLKSINQLIQVHIDGERERYIHDMVEKTATMEVNNSQQTDKMMHMTQKIAKLEVYTEKGRKTQYALDSLQEKTATLQVSLSFNWS